MKRLYYIETRGFALLMLLTGILAIVLAYVTGATHSYAQPRGFLYPSPSQWIADPAWSTAAACLLDALAFLMLFVMNRTFNMVRDAGYLPAGMFMVLQGASAVYTGSFSGGTLMMIVLLIGIALFFTIYQQPQQTRRILAVFTLLGAGALTQYGFVPYVLVFIVGCFQMRVMNMRALIALLAGLLVPAWIVLGSGLEPLGALRWPEFVNPFADGLSMIDAALLAGVAISLITGLVCGVMNMMTVFTRNARTRAFNGLIACAGIVTGAMCVADFTNLTFYIPALNITTAYQVGFFYSVRRNKPARIAIVVLCALYAATYLWSLCQQL